MWIRKSVRREQILKLLSKPMTIDMLAGTLTPHVTPNYARSLLRPLILSGDVKRTRCRNSGGPRFVDSRSLSDADRWEASAKAIISTELNTPKTMAYLVVSSGYSKARIADLLIGMIQGGVVIKVKQPGVRAPTYVLASHSLSAATIGSAGFLKSPITQR